MTWDSIYKSKGAVQKKPKEFYVKAVRSVKNAGSKTALDLGCGTGRHVFLLVKKFKTVLACDPSPTALRILRDGLRNARSRNVVVKQGVYQKIPFKSGSVDFLICSSVLPHGKIMDIRRGIAEMARVLKPGGVIVLDLLHVRDSRRGKGKIVEPNTVVFDWGAEKGIPHHFFTIREARRLFSPCFKLEEMALKTYAQENPELLQVKRSTKIFLRASKK